MKPIVVKLKMAPPILPTYTYLILLQLYRDERASSRFRRLRRPIDVAHALGQSLVSE